MKKTILIAMAILLVTLPVSAALAMEDAHKGHDKGKMGNTGRMGELIREVNVDGYELTYHLIDMQEKMKGMEGMKEMTMTHHLMVYIKAPHGHQIEKAKVGYMIQDPKNEKQKAMTMAMGDGFGADVKMKNKGAYSIKTKILVNDKKLMDEFSHHVH